MTWFSLYRRDYQVKSATLVRCDPKTREEFPLPLTNPRAVEALSNLILTQLELGLDWGRPFVKKLNQEKRDAEKDMYQANDCRSRQDAVQD